MCFNQHELLTSAIDITETKLAGEQLEQMNNLLQRSNARLTQFTAVASHDLQEPLRKIKSFGDLLAEQYAPALGDGMAYLRRMQSAADRMQALIRDLLAYARLTSDQPGAYQPTDLNALLSEVVTDLEVVIAETGAALSVGRLPTLVGDGLQLRQVFQNLLSNALKFTQPGRPPRVTLTARRLGNEELPPHTGLGAGSYWQITVADNGIGFSEKYRERIFSAFERLHSTSSGYAGTGMGLAIVRQVMEHHQGAVTAHSVEGEGATFTLYFPAAE